MLIPTVIDKVGNTERAFDIYSRLLEDRIIFLTGEINMDMANTVVAQLIYLEGKDPNKDIYMYINSPGGEMGAGLAIYDTMKYIKCDISTIAVGWAASMAAWLLSAGTKGKRFSLPHSQIMIHQIVLVGGGNGYTKYTDFKQGAEKTESDNEKMLKILSQETGQPLEKLKKDMMFDKYLTPEEAKEYGLIDEIFVSRKEKKAE